MNKKEVVNNMKEYNENNELVYEEKNMTCNDEQFETFIKLLTNGLVYGKKEDGKHHDRQATTKNNPKRYQKH